MLVMERGKCGSTFIAKNSLCCIIFRYMKITLSIKKHLSNVKYLRCYNKQFSNYNK